MSPRPLPAIVAAAVALLAASTARPAESPVLSAASATAKFTTHRRTGEPRDSLRLSLRLSPTELLGAVDPAADGLRVSVAGVTVLDAPAPLAAKSFRARTRRGRLVRWTWSERGESGVAGSRRLTADARTGDVRVRVRKAGLAALRDAGPEDAVVELTIGDVTTSTRLRFFVSGARGAEVWRYRYVPPTPRPPGPLTFTSLSAGALSNVPRADVEVARDATQFAAVWSALGSPGPLPAVDFGEEMVVVVSSLVVGPGPSPIGLDVSAVRDTGTGVHVDWRLSLCEEPGLCPGAPGVECPTATPFHVFRTRATEGSVGLTRLDSVWVCP